MQNEQFPVHDPKNSRLPPLTPPMNQCTRTNRVRAAIYARVSTSDGRQEVENQLSELRQFAERQDWEVVGLTERQNL